MSRNAIEDPPYWLALINNSLGGWMVVSLLAIFGIVLWIWQKNMDIDDTEAILYSGIVCTIIGALLFVIQITSLPGVKILTWAQLLPFFVITCVALIVNYVQKRY